MGKAHTFAANEVLTKDNLNILLQDGQIVQTTGSSTTDVMSQNAVTTRCVLLNDAQTINGTKTFTGNLRMGTSSGGKINFGDNDYVYLHENSDDVLTIRATTLNLSANTISLTGSGKIPASQISITNGSAFGNATTLQGALDYIANVFNGTITVTSLKTNNLNIV